MSSPIPFIDLGAARLELAGELEAAAARVVESDWYVLGPELEAFEREFAEFCGTRHCVGVGSGMSAIELALRAAGIGAGDEVLVPAYTWIATWAAVSRTGARPVGVDVLEGTYNVDPEQLATAIGERTAAIAPVHLRGEPAEMDAIAEVASAAGLFVVEDAAQAHGARHRGRRVGGIGDAGAFSFYPSKNLGAIGDGGAIVTDDEGLADRLRMLRNYGTRDRYEIEMDGVNSRLAEVQAAALRAKLPHLDRWNAARAAAAESYLAAFDGLESLALPVVPEWAEPVWHLFAIGHPDRDSCRDTLTDARIESLVHYPLLPHRAAAYASEWPVCSFPVAERLAAAELSLPIHPHLEQSERERVAEVVAATVGAAISA